MRAIDSVRRKAERFDARARKWGVDLPWLMFEEKTEDSLDLSRNDYLRLGQNITTRTAVGLALYKHGAGAVTSSALFDQTGPRLALETELAFHIGKDEAMVTGSGFSANSGLMQQIASKGQPVYLDAAVHPSIRQGVLLARADPQYFWHNDVSRLADMMSMSGPGPVVTESVFSTDGSIAPLEEMVDLCRDLNSYLVVDESHSLGTHGTEGRGMVHDLGLTNEIPLITASLSKAFCGRAGMIAFPEELNNYMRMWNWEVIFSSAVMPHEAEGLRATLETIKGRPNLRTALHGAHGMLRESLLDEGWSLPLSNNIVSLPLGTEHRLMRFTKRMEARGIFASMFFFPATPRHGTLYRMSVHSQLSSLDIEDVVDAIAEEIVKV